MDETPKQTHTFKYVPAKEQDMTCFSWLKSLFKSMESENRATRERRENRRNPQKIPMI